VSDCASVSSGDIRNIISLDTPELSALSGESLRIDIGIDVLRVVGPRCSDDGESLLGSCVALAMWAHARAEASDLIAMGSDAAWESNVILRPPVFLLVVDGRGGGGGDIGFHPLLVLGEAGRCD
jgi:hypothetical protein